MKKKSFSLGAGPLRSLIPNLCFVRNLLNETNYGAAVSSLQGLAAHDNDGVGGGSQGLREGVGPGYKLLQHFNTVAQVLKIDLLIFFKRSKLR